MPSHHAQFAPVDLTRISAVSILAGEHRVILQVLAVLEAIAGHAQADSFPADDARQVLDVLRTFADHCHHAKEEDILFPALEALAPGSTEALRADHDESRELIRLMDEAIGGNLVASFAGAAYAYVDLLREHIANEDDDLFRKAQAMLPPGQDAEIIAAYLRLEHDDLGDGTHVHMLAIADLLARSYGVPIASMDPRIMTLLTAVCGCATSAT